jgi:hypothetical protein
MLVGFWGTDSVQQINSLGVFTLADGCWPSQLERPNIFDESLDGSGLGTGAIVVIAIFATIVVLSIPCCFCIYRKLKARSALSVVPNTERGETIDTEAK